MAKDNAYITAVIALAEAWWQYELACRAISLHGLSRPDEDCVTRRSLARAVREGTVDSTRYELELWEGWREEAVRVGVAYRDADVAFKRACLRFKQLQENQSEPDQTDAPPTGQDVAAAPEAPRDEEGS